MWAKVKYYCLCGMVLWLSACSKPAPQPSGKVVRVGVIGPFTGADAALGKSGFHGVKLALALRPLLKNGDRLELVKMDDQSDPEHCEAAYDEMDDSDVAGVLLLSRSNSALAISRRARIHRIPVIATIASHPELTDDNPHLIQLSFDDTFQGSVAAMFVRDELLLARAVVIDTPEDQHAQALADAFADKFVEAAGVVVDRIEWSNVETNMASRLDALQQQRVEILYAPLQAHQLIALTQQLEELKWRPVVMAGDGTLSEMMLEHPEELELTQGMLATDTFGGDPAKTVFGRAFLAGYEAGGGQRGSTFTILAGEGLALIRAALDQCGPEYDHRDIQDALRSLRNFDAYAGVISVREDGKVIRPVYVNTIREGRLDNIVRVY